MIIIQSGLCHNARQRLHTKRGARQFPYLRYSTVMKQWGGQILKVRILSICRRPDLSRPPKHSHRRRFVLSYTFAFYSRIPYEYTTRTWHQMSRRRSLSMARGLFEQDQWSRVVGPTERPTFLRREERRFHTHTHSLFSQPLDTNYRRTRMKNPSLLDTPIIYPNAMFSSAVS